MAINWFKNSFSSKNPPALIVQPKVSGSVPQKLSEAREENASGSHRLPGEQMRLLCSHRGQMQS